MAGTSPPPPFSGPSEKKEEEKKNMLSLRVNSAVGGVRDYDDFASRFLREIHFAATYIIRRYLVGSERSIRDKSNSPWSTYLATYWSGFLFFSGCFPY